MSDRITIDGFVIDLAVSVEANGDAEATQFPVERGAPSSDHVINKPWTLSVEWMVSDTPIGDVYDQRPAGTTPSVEARAFLEELQASKRAFVVEHGGRRWEDQVFTSLNFAEDADKSGGLFGTAVFQTLNIVDVRRVVVQGLVVASAKLPGRKLWLCPEGVPVVKSDAENLRHRCRVVEEQFGYLRFADTGVALTDADLARLAAQRINTATGLSVPGDARWDPIAQQWTRDGVPVTVTKDQFFEKFLGVPPDYTPPTDSGGRQELGNGREQGRNI